MSTNNDFWCKIRVDKYNCDPYYLHKINNIQYGLDNVAWSLLRGCYQRVIPYNEVYNFAFCTCLFLDKDFRHVLILDHGNFYQVGIVTEFVRNYPKEKIDRKKEYLRIKSEIDRLQQEKEQLFIKNN